MKEKIRTEWNITNVLLGVLIAIFCLQFAPTSLVLRSIETKVSVDGIVTFNREPIYDGIVVEYQTEIVTPEGKTCSAPRGQASYEKTDSNTVVYKVHPNLIPCLEKGSIMRVTRKFWLLGQTVEETVVGE